ncbi:MAG: cobalt ECF transporter T component CbiQ [Caldisericia bacterium]|nr:cobalt ECF transporter T component CbiQ [Caldisericia bacterium]
MIKNPLLKFLFTILFIFSVISINNRELEKLLIYLIIILILIIASKIKVKTFLKKLFLLLPFIIIFSITNLFMKYKISSFDKLNFVSITLKPVISLSAIILLIETTNFVYLIQSLKILGIPKEILNTTLLIYRYFFILLDEIKKIEIARDMRYFGGYFKRQVKVYSNIIGVLLLRSIERSERIFNAMKLRGYENEIRYILKLELNKKEIFILFLFILILIFIRIA